MTINLLHIEGSPRKTRSASLHVARAFLDEWTAAVPDTHVDTLDVWAEDLPEFNGPVLEAKYAGIVGKELTPAQEHAWQQIRTLAARLTAADVIVVSSPMWNFGIPYRLKQLIDAISQKDVLFRFDGHQLTGMLADRTGIIVAARGDTIGSPTFPDDTYDHQISYLTGWFHMVGVTDVHAVVIDNTFQPATADARSRQTAALIVRDLAHELARQAPERATPAHSSATL